MDVVPGVDGVRNELTPFVKNMKVAQREYFDFLLSTWTDVNIISHLYSLHNLGGAISSLCNNCKVSNNHLLQEERPHVGLLDSTPLPPSELDAISTGQHPPLQGGFVNSCVSFFCIC